MNQTTTHQDRVFSDQERLLPRMMIRAMVALVCACLALVSFARLTDRPLESTPPISPVVAEAAFTLASDGVSGAVQVYDLQGVLVWDMTPEQGGFVAGIHRVILRERAKHRVAEGAPVILRAMENGRMAIADPSTGWSADLMGFGADNASVFAQMLVKLEERN